METQHTPGPWIYFKNNNYQCIRTDKEKITEYNGNAANAYLIVTAPEMLKALCAAKFRLEHLQKMYDLTPQDVHELNQINEVIKKANPQL